MNSTVLITGALGQVGSRCTEILLSRGCTVIATDLRTDRALCTAQTLAGNQHPGTLEISFADLLDEAAIAGLIVEHRPDAIVHLAGILAPSSYRNPQLARRVNVQGTVGVVRAAQSLPVPPLIVFASSAAVFGSRNPYRHPERITERTPVSPADHYGEDKLLAEVVVRDSGLPYATLRLGGVISPDAVSNLDGGHLLMMRAMPGDNRLHTVDSRDAALAFANAVDRRETIDGRVLLIAGNDTHLHTHREVEDDMLEAVGIGRLGPTASLSGDPSDDRGWGPTGWFDTTESQALLEFHNRDWSDTVAWVAQSQSRQIRRALRVAGPFIRQVMRTALVVQRKIERSGAHADPWKLIANEYGLDVLAQSFRSPLKCAPAGEA